MQRNEPTVDDPRMSEYLAGNRLVGDDYSGAEIESWFADEVDGYAQLTEADQQGTEGAHGYGYGQLNEQLGFRYLGRRDRMRVLGLGAANGDELVPIAHRCSSIEIVEPAGVFHSGEIASLCPTSWSFPSPSGSIDFPSRSFDLVTSLGVLHHIPNVTYVLQEISRVLTDGGTALIREPITSLGDWRFPRAGLTKRERGIPLQLFRKQILEAGLTIRKETPCIFSPIARLGRAVDRSPYASKASVRIDAVASRLFLWNYRYHAVRARDRIRPGAVFYVLDK